ncbi:MAG TPA: hypothetical protein VFL55_13370 [Acetobacteraceae bacterium]|nr:hypothetical protein [Acetobacteraceae bacterium]
MNGPKNLMLGFCSRRSLDHVAPFVASLLQSAFTGDVCLLVDGIAAVTVHRLRELGIIVERAAPSAQASMAAMSSRYFSYFDFLLRHGDGYTNVMLVDPVTAVVQGDPFAAPLAAEIVYVAIGCAIGELPDVSRAIAQGYGEAVAHNIRDCIAASPATTFGTLAGMRRYLAAMTHQFAGRTVPITGLIDQGVHNYVVHMRPLAGAWLDDTGDVVQVANDTVAITDHGLQMNGRFAPVVTGWDTSTRVLVHVRTSPRYRLDHISPPPARPAASRRDAVAAFYHRQRDHGWLELFLGSLRCVNDTADIYCVGDFDQAELAAMARFRALGFVLPACDPAAADNVAHLYLNQALEGIATSGVQLDQLLLLDGMRAAFPRDPFLNKTVGLSLFCEGPVRIRESEFNRHRLSLFTDVNETSLRQPVVSSMALRGPLPLLREFYRRMFLELVDRAELLKIPKVVQGIVNKLCHADDLGFPMIVHPNGAEVLFDLLGPALGVSDRHGLRIGGTVPGVVLGSHQDSPLLLRLRVDLNLPEPDPNAG